ncbi:MAG TPA: hypothetical protein VGP36_02190 [Mycobacteriales bacterium]|nr:hypothetical protein [Mycobacteriales bacterium]
MELLAAGHGFNDLSRLNPDRGDAGRLCEIAWFGSAVADIASSGDGSANLRALRTGGLFNVAVALVDSVVDRRRDGRAGGLTVALAPPALRDRLLVERPLDTEGPGGEIVALMDVVLRDVAERWRHDPQMLAEAHELLTRMYISEMRPGVSRRDAKLLPLTFVGVVSDHARRPAVRETVQGISRFAGLLDDWQDLGDDLVAGRANAFLHERDLAPATSAPRALTGARLIARPRKASSGIAGQVRAALLTTVEAARRAGGDVEAKTHAFLRCLLMP